VGIKTIQGGPKNGPYLKCMTPADDEVGRRSMYQNVELFIKIKLMSGMSPYLNILGITLEKRHCTTENTN